MSFIKIGDGLTIRKDLINYLLLTNLEASDLYQATVNLREGDSLIVNDLSKEDAISILKKFDQDVGIIDNEEE